MDVCEKCHDLLGCEQQHPKVILHCGETCGVCSGSSTAYTCSSPIANEIASYNRAVAVFVLTMRAKFLENIKDKGGWQEISYGYAIKRLNHEAGELAEALLPAVRGASHLRAIADEASDVANFALFIANRALDEDSRNRAIEKHTDEVLKRLETEKAGRT